jgi:hypothetical protein
VSISTSDNAILASELDAVALYRSMLESYVSAIRMPD